MSNSAVAAYSPEMQLITLRPEFEAFSDPGNPKGFSTPEQVAIFFHEWIHYLHNVSTILGLTTFSNLTVLWSNFRNTFGKYDWSQGANGAPRTHVDDMERQYAYMSALRGRKQNSLPKNLGQGEVRITSVKIVPFDKRRPNELQFLECDAVVIHQQSGNHEPSKVLVGTHEILEYAAIMLEELAALALGTVLKQASVDPYYLVPAIATGVAPTLSKECVLMCALASLQYPDPPRQLIKLLELGESAFHQGQDPQQRIRDFGMELLYKCLPSAEKTLCLLDEIFELDSPISRSIKYTTAQFRRNLSYRRQNLFFEFEIIDQLRSDVKSMNDAVFRHGAPTLIQQRTGDPDQPERDLMYEFSLPDHSQFEFSEGRRLIHAAHRFMGAHFRGGQLQPTAEITSSGCPFYTACPNNYRKMYPENCRLRPWLSADSAVGLCDYAVAVISTRLPSDGKSRSA